MAKAARLNRKAILWASKHMKTPPDDTPRPPNELYGVIHYYAYHNKKAFVEKYVSILLEEEDDTAFRDDARKFADISDRANPEFRKGLENQRQCPACGRAFGEEPSAVLRDPEGNPQQPEVSASLM